VYLECLYSADTNVSFLGYFAIDLRRLPIYVLFIIFPYIFLNIFGCPCFPPHRWTKKSS